MLFPTKSVSWAAAILWLGFSAPFDLPAQGQVVSLTNANLRIMAANLNGNTQSYQDFELRIFQGLKPDVVAIQEFNYLNNTPADLRSMINTAFGPEFEYYRESGAGKDIPNGIISRYPIAAAGFWTDTEVANRSFVWARVRLPGTNDLYIVSVHLLTSGATERSIEAAEIKQLVAANFPADAWIVVAGDLNTDSRTEAAVTTLKTFLTDLPVPTDAEFGGDPDTNNGRNKPYDYVLPSPNLAALQTNSVFVSHSFSNGLVFDSRVYTPLSDVPPVLSADSSTCQHMGVIKDFRIVYWVTNGVPEFPQILVQPRSQTNGPGSNVTFAVQAVGAPPLFYEWRFNGAPIAGATASSYTRTNVQSADAGRYSVAVSNSNGGLISSDAWLAVGTLPVISTQPRSQVVDPGAAATFSVVATGIPAPGYQWRLAGANLAGATDSVFTVTNVQAPDLGNYSVVLSNAIGSVLSADAWLGLNTAQATVIAQWDFNSVTPDATTTTGSTAPSTGSGAASLVGGTTGAFFGGSATDPANSGTDNSGWSSTTYPATTVGDKTAGVQFAVSTVGRQNIVVRWDQRASNTGSKYSRLLYSTNGTSFYPAGPATANTTIFEGHTNGLAGLPNVDNNPNFVFRIVSEFESTATGGGASGYVGANGTYAGTGTERFDMVTVTGLLVPPPAPTAPGLLSPPVYGAGSRVEFSVSGTPGSNYVVQALYDLAQTNWIPLWTNAAPFSFTDTNVGPYPQKFYRAVPGP